MSDNVEAQGHLPECPTGNPYTDLTLCICDRLFACEARVFVDRTDHWNAALDAARDAMEHFHRGSCRWYYAERRCTCGLNESIAALKEKK